MQMEFAARSQEEESVFERVGL